MCGQKVSALINMYWEDSIQLEHWSQLESNPLGSTHGCPNNCTTEITSVNDSLYFINLLFINLSVKWVVNKEAPIKYTIHQPPVCVYTHNTHTLSNNTERQREKGDEQYTHIIYMDVYIKYNNILNIWWLYYIEDVKILWFSFKLLDND